MRVALQLRPAIIRRRVDVRGLDERPLETAVFERRSRRGPASRPAHPPLVRAVSTAQRCSTMRVFRATISSGSRFDLIGRRIR